MSRKIKCKKLTILLFVFAVGVAFTLWLAQSTDKRMRAELLVLAQIAAQSINVEHVTALSGSEQDLNSPAYQRLKAQLISIYRAGHQCQFLYLLGQRSDGEVFIFVDSQPEDSKDYAPPGLIYEEVSDSYLNTFNNNQEAVVGPVSDRWGTMISALVPLNDPASGHLVAVLGMDVNANNWNKKILGSCFFPVTAMLLFVGLILLFTSREQAVQAQQASEERYRNFLDTAMVGFFRSRLSDGLYLEVNAKAAEQIGYKIEEIVGKIKTIDLFQNLSQRKKLLSSLEEEGYVNDFEVDLLLPNGRECSYSISVKAYPDKDYMEGIAIDISGRKRAQALLKESEERFRNMAELLPEPIFESNAELVVTYANLRASELFGFSEEDFAKGLCATDMFAPEEIQRVVKNTAAQFRGEKKERTEYRCIKKDGSSFPALFHVSPMVKNGKPCGLRGVVVDLTEQKQAEEEILKLRKLESVGVLAGGIAHDFNNLLAGLFGNIEMAKRFLPDEHKSYKYLDSAGISMERATGLTQQLLTFAKGGDPIKETLSLGGVITETASFSLRGSNVKLQLDIDPDLWLVDADKGQLSQVVSNLVINAKQAMPDGGSISINAGNIETAEGRQVQITVQDQGIGIAPQHLNKIFDPYFSTKQQGSGLGLASSYSIISKHNGTIVAESELNRGTTFTIILPAAGEQKEIAAAIPEVAPPPGNTATAARILVLEDEDMVQQMSGAMLEEMGHQVNYAVDGEEAVKKYRTAQEEGQEYNIVICDLTIPGGMGGQEAAREILKLDPQAKLIVSSGYATDPVMADYAAYRFNGRVAKPYRFAELQKVIQQVLEV